MLFRSPSVSGFTCSLIPGMAMLPSGLVNEAIIRQRPITGSGTGPPHMPECTLCFSARTSTLVAHLRSRGILATGLNYPVVPKGEEEIRFQISADHVAADIDEALAALGSFKE